MRIKKPVTPTQANTGDASAPTLAAVSPSAPVLLSPPPHDQLQFHNNNQQVVEEEGVVYKFVNTAAAHNQHHLYNSNGHGMLFANHSNHSNTFYPSAPPTVYNIDYNNNSIYNSNQPLYPTVNAAATTTSTLATSDFDIEVAQQAEDAQKKLKLKQKQQEEERNEASGVALTAVAKDNNSITKQELPAFVIHELQSEDTLFTLALSYGVSVEDIKLRNGVLNDDLAFYDKREMVIPYPSLLPPKYVYLNLNLLVRF